MSAAGGHDAHGSGALGKVAGWVAVATFAIIVINGGFNLLDGRNFWEGIFSGTPRTNFQGTVSGGTGKQTGARGNCPSGVTVGQPYDCRTSRTGMCVCK